MQNKKNNECASSNSNINDITTSTENPLDGCQFDYNKGPQNIRSTGSIISSPSHTYIDAPVVRDDKYLQMCSCTTEMMTQCERIATLEAENKKLTEYILENSFSRVNASIARVNQLHAQIATKEDEVKRLARKHTRAQQELDYTKEILDQTLNAQNCSTRPRRLSAMRANILTASAIATENAHAQSAALIKSQKGTIEKQYYYLARLLSVMSNAESVYAILNEIINDPDVDIPYPVCSDDDDA